MTLRETLDNLKKSEIYKLVFEGHILGLRVKTYNIDKGCFNYYDFETSIISNQGVKDFINSINKQMKSIELQRYNGLLMSKDEVENGITIMEFEDEAQASLILQPFIRIYKYKGVV